MPESFNPGPNQNSDNFWKEISYIRSKAFTYVLDSIKNEEGNAGKFFESFEAEEECIREKQVKYWQIACAKYPALNSVLESQLRDSNDPFLCLARARTYGLEYDFNQKNVSIEDTGKIDARRIKRRDVYKYRLQEEEDSLQIVKLIPEILENDEYDEYDEKSEFYEQEKGEFFTENDQYRSQVLAKARQKLQS